MLTGTPTFGARGMVATASYLATQAGLDVLKQGGNAIDAAIAASAAMTVVYTPTCSAGGDLFMLIWDAKSQKLHALNGSGRAPAAMTPELFASKNLSRIPERGPLCITVPGAVDAWFTALERFGTRTPTEVLSAAISYAEDGIAMIPKISAGLRNVGEKIFAPYKSSRDTYLPNGRAPRPGELFRQPNLARTYKTLAKDGRDAFYNGPIGEEIASSIQKDGGVLSIEDLRSHHSNWVTPISTNYRGYEVYEFPPNTQGIAALEMLNILEGFDLKELGYQSPEYLHLLLEAKKLAYADRDRYIADPDFMDIPLDRLLSKEYAASLRERIRTDRAQPTAELELSNDGDTMYLCTTDQYGNSVSLIHSLYFGFGSGVVGGDTGVLMQSRGHYFSLDPRHKNYLQPGRRTMHTLTPAMVLRDEKPYLVLGTMGGDAQPQVHVQLLSAIIDFDKNVQEAVDAPRWHSGRFELPLENNVLVHGQKGVDPEEKIVEGVMLESRFSEQVQEGLKDLGHHTMIRNAFDDLMGHAQVIFLNPETQTFEGAADPRCDGLALGW